MTEPAPLVPYPGLRPFKKEEAQFFFGQDEPQERLRQRIGEDRFVAILGLSGCGKSSLLQAGLLADLETKQITGSLPRWLIGYMRPGADPLGGLLNLLQDVTQRLDLQNSPDDDEPAFTVIYDVADLTADSCGLARFGRNAGLYETKLDGQRILLVVDQFEELFRYQRDADTHEKRARAALFVQLLLEAARDPECRISIILTMRSEFLGDCALFYGLAEQVNRGTFLLPRMTREGIEEVITGPAEEARFTIDPEVVQRLLNEAEAEDDGLPLLQHALRRIWDRWRQRGGEGPISLADLQNFDRAQGTGTALIKRHLDDHLDFIYQSLGNRKAAAELLFRLLSEKDSRGRLTRRPVRFSQRLGEFDPQAEPTPTILDSIGVDKEEDIRAIIDEFRDEKRGRTFLTPEAGRPLDGQFIDVCHECLLRRWSRLQHWIHLEEFDAGQFRRFADDTDEAAKKTVRKPLEGITLHKYFEWRRKSQLLDEGWGLRYVGHFSRKLGRQKRSWAATEEYLTWSQAEARRRKAERIAEREAQIRLDEKSRHRQRRLISSLVGFALLAVAAVYGWSQFREKYSLQASVRGARARELTAYAALSQSEDPSRALYLGLSAARMVQPPPPGVQEILATALTNGPSSTVLRGHRDSVLSVAWSPDGKTLASAGMDHTIRLWDASTGLSLHTMQGVGDVFSISWSPDGRKLASSGRNEQPVRLWNAATGRQLRAFGPVPAMPSAPREVLTAVAWSPDGATLAATSHENIELWDAASGGLLRTLSANVKYGMGTIAWSPDGKRLLGVSGPEVWIWDAASGNLLRVLGNQSGFVNSAAWNTAGDSIATGSRQMVQFWDAVRGVPIQAMQGSAGLGQIVAWSPHGNTLVAAGGTTIGVWDASTGLPHRTLQGHTNNVSALAWSPDGKTLASASLDKTIRLWQVADGQPIRTLPNDPVVALAVAWGPGAGVLAVGAADDNIHLWDAAAGLPLRLFQGNRGPVTSVAWSPDGKTLASASVDMTVRLWNAATGQPLGTLVGHRSDVRSVAWSPDSKTVASAGYDKTVRLWDAAGARPLRTLEGSRQAIRSVAWSPDGKSLASGGDEAAIRLWDAASGRPLRIMQGNPDGVESVAWSPDGKTLASGGHDQEVRIWDPASGRLLHTLHGHQGSVNTLGWSPDSRTLASGSDDQTIRLWDAATGRPLRLLQGHPESVISLAWSRDGHTIASADDDGFVLLWPGDAETLLNQIRYRMRLFSLSKDECQRYFSTDSCPPIH